MTVIDKLLTRRRITRTDVAKVTPEKHTGASDKWYHDLKGMNDAAREEGVGFDDEGNPRPASGKEVLPDGVPALEQLLEQIETVCRQAKLDARSVKSGPRVGAA